MSDITQLLINYLLGGGGSAGTANASGFSAASGNPSALAGLSATSPGAGFANTSAGGATSGTAGGNALTPGGSSTGNLANNAPASPAAPTVNPFAAVGQGSPIALPADIQAQLAPLFAQVNAHDPMAALGVQLDPNGFQVGSAPWGNFNPVTPYSQSTPPSWSPQIQNDYTNAVIANAAGVTPDQIASINQAGLSQYPQWAWQAINNLQSSELNAPPQFTAGGTDPMILKMYQDAVTNSPIYNQLLGDNLQPWYSAYASNAYWPYVVSPTPAPGGAAA